MFAGPRLHAEAGWQTSLDLSPSQQGASAYSQGRTTQQSEELQVLTPMSSSPRSTVQALIINTEQDLQIKTRAVLSTDIPNLSNDFRTNPANNSSENKATSGQAALKSFFLNEGWVSLLKTQRLLPSQFTPPLNSTNPTLDRDAEELKSRFAKVLSSVIPREKVLNTSEVHCSLAVNDLVKSPLHGCACVSGVPGFNNRSPGFKH